MTGVQTCALPIFDWKEWPFVKWLIEVYYKTQIDQDMELNEYYKGVYATPLAGIAGENGTGMNGVQHLLRAGVEQGTINSIDIGTLNASNIFDQIEAFTDEISEVYQGVKMNVFMSRHWLKKYLQDKRVQGFYQKFSEKDIDSGIDFALPCESGPIRALAPSCSSACPVWWRSP